MCGRSTGARGHSPKSSQANATHTVHCPAGMEAERGAELAPEELAAAADQQAVGAGQQSAAPANHEAASSGADGGLPAPPADIDEPRKAEASAEVQPAGQAAGEVAGRASAAPSRLQQAPPAGGSSGVTADILRIEHSQDEAVPVLGGLVDLQAESSNLLSGAQLQQEQAETAGTAGAAAAGEPTEEEDSCHEAEKLGAQKQRVASVLGKGEAAGEGKAQGERGPEGEGEGLEGGIKALWLGDQPAGGARASSSLGAQAPGQAQSEAPAAAVVVVPKLAVGLASGSGAGPATARSARSGAGTKSARGGSGATPRFSARRASVAVGKCFGYWQVLHLSPAASVPACCVGCQSCSSWLDGYPLPSFPAAKWAA